MNDKQPCFCDSHSLFECCCGPLLSGQSQAKTAEQLMRSRFSAFCRGNIDYLISSHHPLKRQTDDRQSLATTISQCQWLKLTIEKTTAGLETDNKGEVEYSAVYKQRNQLSQLHENSHFVKEHGQWFYWQGDILSGGCDPKPVALKPGRNNVCWCGSGKKFKKCHG